MLLIGCLDRSQEIAKPSYFRARNGLAVPRLPDQILGRGPKLANRPREHRTVRDMDEITFFANTPTINIVLFDER